MGRPNVWYSRNREKNRWYFYLTINNIGRFLLRCYLAWVLILVRAAPFDEGFQKKVQSPVISCCQTIKTRYTFYCLSIPIIDQKPVPSPSTRSLIFITSSSEVILLYFRFKAKVAIIIILNCYKAIGSKKIWKELCFLYFWGRK